MSSVLPPRMPLAGRYRFTQSLPSVGKTPTWLAADERGSGLVVLSAVGAGRRRSLAPALAVRHPHLASLLAFVDTFDADEIPGGARLQAASIGVAEHVPGGTLHEQLRLHRLAPRDAATWFIRLADALVELHDAGAAHGAITPKAIVIAPEARAARPVLTQLAVPATGAYSAPERLAGGPPTPADDVWALHACLYAAIVGVAPFEAKSKDELLAAMQAKRWPRLALAGVDDDGLEALIDKGLEPNLGLRTLHAVDLRAALERWLQKAALEDWDDDEPRLTGTSLHPVEPPGRRLGDDEGVTIPDSVLPSPPSTAPPGLALAAPRAPWASAPTLEVSASTDDAPLSVEPLEADRLLAALASEEDDAPTAEPALARQVGPLPPPSLPPLPRPTWPPAPAHAEAAPPAGAVLAVAQASSAPLEPAAAVATGPSGRPQRSESTPKGIPLWGAIAGGVAVLGAVVGVGLALTATPATAPGGRSPLSASSSAVAGATATTLPSRAAPPGPRAPSGAALGTPPPSATAAAPSATAAAPSATAAASSAVVASAASAPPAPSGVDSCVTSWFGEGTFRGGESFAFLCDPVDLRDLTSKLHTRIVSSGGGKVTPGMKEWSMFGWYQLAAAAAIRLDCCPGAGQKLETPAAGPVCKSVGELLGAQLAPLPAPGDVRARATAIEAGLLCLFNAPAPRPYTFRDRPTASNRTVFEGFLERRARR